MTFSKRQLLTDKPNIHVYHEQQSRSHSKIFVKFVIAL